MAVRFIRSGAYFIIRDSVSLDQILRNKRDLLTFTELEDGGNTDYVFSYDPVATTKNLKDDNDGLDLRYAFTGVLDEDGVAFPTQADCTKFLNETFFF